MQNYFFIKYYMCTRYSIGCFIDSFTCKYIYIRRGSRGGWTNPPPFEFSKYTYQRTTFFCFNRSIFVCVFQIFPALYAHLLLFLIYHSRMKIHLCPVTTVRQFNLFSFEILRTCIVHILSTSVQKKKTNPLIYSNALPVKYIYRCITNDLRPKTVRSNFHHFLKI